MWCTPANMITQLMKMLKDIVRALNDLTSFIYFSIKNDYL